MQTTASIALALIWAISGFYVKTLRGTPRHELIVARFIGPRLSRLFTIIIGCMEVAMAG